MAMSAKEVFELVLTKNIQAVDIRFMDFPGLWQHFTIPANMLTMDEFEEGLGFDASSMRGWKAINESDMLVMPQADTAFIDPFSKTPTLVMIANIQDPVTKQDYDKDPRHIAIKAENYLKTSGIGEVSYWGPEAEFFIFDKVRFGCEMNSSFYEVDSNEGWWTRGRELELEPEAKAKEKWNMGYKIRPKEGYFPVPPMDKQQEMRNEMMLLMNECGLQVERQHHEVATAGQAEIDFKFDTLVTQADNLLKFKYIVKNVAAKYGRSATFMPKPLFGDNGSGMHVHVSVWKKGKNLFAGDSYGGLSEMALYAIGGMLKHARSLCAITNPTTNSYKRLVPGYEAPVNLAYSSRNRSAVCRIPMYSTSPKSKRVEYRCPDASCNPYLAFAAIQMAMIDGILNKIDPGQPLDKDIYDLPPEELARVPSAPGSLEEAFRALEADKDYLLVGDVFTNDVLEGWMEYKRKKEIDPVRLMPHPKEFELYYDI